MCTYLESYWFPVASAHQSQDNGSPAGFTCGFHSDLKGSAEAPREFRGSTRDGGSGAIGRAAWGGVHAGTAASVTASEEATDSGLIP